VARAKRLPRAMVEGLERSAALDMAGCVVGEEPLMSLEGPGHRQEPERVLLQDVRDTHGLELRESSYPVLSPSHSQDASLSTTATLAASERQGSLPMPSEFDISSCSELFSPCLSSPSASSPTGKRRGGSRGWSRRWSSTGLCGLLPGGSGRTARQRASGTATPTASASLPVGLEAAKSPTTSTADSLALSAPPVTPAVVTPGLQAEQEAWDKSTLSPSSTLPGMSPVPRAGSVEVGFDTEQPSAGQSGHSTINNVGVKEPLSSLIEEFRFNTRFGEKVRHLQGLGYNGWRRIRGDGNCFYRAVGVGLLEQGILVGARRCGEWAAAFEEKLASINFQDTAERAAHDELRHFLRDLLDGSVTGTVAEDRAFATLNHASSFVDLALVRALRFLTAAFLKANRDNVDVANGLPPDLLCSSLEFDGVDGFCKEVVLPMGIEAQDLVQIALPQALGIVVRIVFLERGGQAEVPLCDHGVDGIEGTSATEEGGKPFIHVQLRPGHYDLLYFESNRRADQDTCSREAGRS